jgi:hypothetical protein
LTDWKSLGAAGGLVTAPCTLRSRPPNPVFTKRDETPTTSITSVNTESTVTGNRGTALAALIQEDIGANQKIRTATRTALSRSTSQRNLRSSDPDYRSSTDSSDHW